MKITGIILAGGKSSRMGTDKAMIRMEGISLLERAIKNLQPVCDIIRISSGIQEHGEFGYEIIPDEIANCGPIGGIYTGLKCSVTNWNFFISVDTPFVNTDFIRFLVSKKEDFEAVVPVHGNRKEPLVALYHKSCIANLEKEIKEGNFKLHNFLNKVKVNFVDVREWEIRIPKMFVNLNKREDMGLTKI